MDDDRRGWDERYAATASVEPAPPEALKYWPDLVALLPDAGRCLDIASGPGTVTLWFAERGVDVTALDVSGVAIELLRSAAERAGLADRVDARAVDLDDGFPVDLGRFDIVVCQRFRDRRLYAPMIEQLRPGGVAIVTVLSSVGCPEPGRFHAPEGELEEAFGVDERCEVLRSTEGDGVAHVVVRRR